MSAETEAVGRLVEQAHAAHVVVVGGGMAGLVAALECAKVGLRVTVVEACDRVGGVVRGAEVAGVTLDAGAESYATRGGTVRALIDELGLGDAVVTPAAGAAWVAGVPGVGAARLPGGGVLGIPDNPWSPDVRRVIGWPGAWRAYLDRLRPPLTIGHQRSLGALVRSRMGARVLDRLVAPVTSGVYSARPDDIDVDLAAPGLSTALTRTGSLAGAVAQLKAGRTEAPGSAVEGLDGGMRRLPEALRGRLADLGAEVITSTSVTAIAALPGGRWTVAIDGAADAESAPDPEPRRAVPAADPAVPGTAEPGPGVPAGAGPRSTAPDPRPASTRTPDPLLADAVIVATPEREARRLLAATVPALGRAAGASPEVEIVTLALDAPALDSAPRGTGVLTVPGAFVAKALTHSTAKWAWLRHAADGLHLVRVSFGAQGEAPATAALDDTDAAALALAEASALLGVPLAPAQLRGAHRARFAQSQPASQLGRAESVAAARAAVRAVPRLAAVGAWLAGTGLAQVVPDAQREAERIRRVVLFGTASDPQ